MVRIFPTFLLGKDACGKCNGDNSTCLDCAGVPNGKNKTDLCNDCVQETDPLFNRGCGTRLDKFHPVVGYYEGNMSIEIDASNLNDKHNLSCFFVSDTTRYVISGLSGVMQGKVA